MRRLDAPGVFCVFVVFRGWFVALVVPVRGFVVFVALVATRGYSWLLVALVVHSWLSWLLVATRGSRGSVRGCSWLPPMTSFRIQRLTHRTHQGRPNVPRVGWLVGR